MISPLFLKGSFGAFDSFRGVSIGQKLVCIVRMRSKETGNSVCETKHMAEATPIRVYLGSWFEGTIHGDRKAWLQE